METSLCRTRTLHILLGLLFVFLFYTESSADDIVLTGTQTLRIENTAYSNKGNIHLHDSAILIIRNATFDFQQDFHEQYGIVLRGNATLRIINNSVLTSSQRFLVGLFDNSQVIVDSSTALNDTLGRGAYFQPNDNSTFSCKDSLIDAVGDMYSYTNESLANITIQDSTVHAVAFHFPLNSSANVQNVGTGFIAELRLLKSETSLPYNLTIFTSTIENEVNAWVKDSADVTFSNCRFHQISMDDQASVSLINTTVTELVPRFGDVAIALSNLTTGQIDSFEIDLSAANSFVIRVRDSYVGGYYIRTFSTNLRIDDSHLVCLRPAGDSFVTVNNSIVDELMFWDFTGSVNFRNCVAENWADTRNYPPAVNNFLIRGTVVINRADLINAGMGNQWLSTIVRREFPCRVSANNPASATVQILAPGGKIVFTRNPDWKGNIVAGPVSFDAATYDKPWKIRLTYRGQVLDEKELRISSSTPIQLSTQVLLPKAASQHGIMLLLTND